MQLFVSNSTQIKTAWNYLSTNDNSNNKSGKEWCRWKLLLWLFQPSLTSVWEPQNDLLDGTALRGAFLFVLLDNTDERQQPILLHCISILDTAHALGITVHVDTWYDAQIAQTRITHNSICGYMIQHTLCAFLLRDTWCSASIVHYSRRCCSLNE